MNTLDELAELTKIPLSDIQFAQKRLNGEGIIRTPLIPLNYDVKDKTIYLKLENLQFTSSFKPRGSVNAIQTIPRGELGEHGIWTASAGNFAQGLSWAARKNGIQCNVLTPDTIPETKVNAIERFGGKIYKVPYEHWWEVLSVGRCENMHGYFIHPGCNKNVIAGNGTIGLEIVEDLPNVDTIICPYGSGGLVSGVASALLALNPTVKVHVCEPETSAPVRASLEAGKPSVVTDYKPSFVDGMGGKSMIPQMWSLVHNLVSSSVVVRLREIADATKLLVENNRVIAEGAGAATVAAALSDEIPPGNIVCVISGGNIDTHKLIDILQNNVPK